MSPEQPLQNQALASRRQIPINLAQLKRTPGLNVIGIPELIGLAGAALLALITVFAYFYFFVPSHSRLTSTRLERDRLQGQLQASQKNVQETSSTSDAVNKINASLEDFQSNWLAARDTGRMSLYTTLNNLIRSNGLRNTAGPSYTALDPLGTKQQVQPTASAEAKLPTTSTATPAPMTRRADWRSAMRPNTRKPIPATAQPAVSNMPASASGWPWLSSSFGTSAARPASAAILTNQ